MVILDVTEGKSFYNDSRPEALRQAQRYAGKRGHVASMPQLLHGRVVAPFEDEIWNWYIALTEEDAGRTVRGKDVLAVTHGGGILRTPKRILRAYSDGLIDDAARFSDGEFRSLLCGRPSGSEVPVFSYKEFLKKDLEPTARYTVVMDLDTARQTESGYQPVDALHDNPLFIVRAGGREKAERYLKRLKQKGTKRYGNWHPFKDIDPAQAQGRLVFLGLVFGGLGGYFHLGGRFAAVKG